MDIQVYDPVMEAIIFGLVGLLLLLILGWIKLDIKSVSEKVDSVGDRVGIVGESVARLEGRLDQHMQEHH